ncbi:Methyltransferase domain-containing protein [Desulfuromusa kysingii]|uniref:Methyltransferase domain-containing protein n=1 Tax=Desulfuromusa kysingii TaxID=37625 RepID=A0A1H4B9M8_9BACT|nr:class I SAM-dependent methyltransferase [Desulfuromusa kysingii]SEA44827.1 Methyltransferase domain-containing protein [Desulfuromusa kysingii]
MKTSSHCRFCGESLNYTFVDLGMTPLCESYIDADHLNMMEPFYPLHVYVCPKCFLVQLEEYVNPHEIFCDYAYFSSYSDSWLQHAKTYTEMMTSRYSLNDSSHVVELASNDGYLLQNFVAAGIPALGIEPAKNVAQVAIDKGITTITEFFGVKLAKSLVDDGKQADLLLGNNVLAQVPDLNDFVAGMKLLLKQRGVITMEFPHLVRLMEENQFDTIYHEHFSYFSLIAVEKVFAAHGLTIFDVEQLPTHGGSLRIYACHTGEKSHPTLAAVTDLRTSELNFGLTQMATYASFAEQVRETKRKLLEFLINCKRKGKTVVGYGAPGKGNTLLNYCGIGTDFIDFTVDRNPHKQGKFSPGTHIPIYHPDGIKKFQPDFLLILPWNLKKEIISQNSYVYDWGGKFVVPIPEVAVF